MIGDPFFSDLIRFGRDRAFARMRHREIVRDFKRTQQNQAFVAFWFIGLFSFTDFRSLFLPLAVAILQKAIAECRRMRACGRYWRCNRSIEVIGI